MEYTCDRCHGTGIEDKKRQDKNKGNNYFINSYLNSFNSPCYEACEKCNGTGKLNWIENIFGKISEENTLTMIVRPVIPIELIEDNFIITKDGVITKEK